MFNKNEKAFIIAHPFLCLISYILLNIESRALLFSQMSSSSAVFAGVMEPFGFAPSGVRHRL